MGDPHVETLVYTLAAQPGYEFANAPALRGETDEFTYELVAGVLTLRMKVHCASEAEARAVAEPFLDAWGKHSHLATGQPPLTFNFDRAEVVDRDPSAMHPTFVAGTLALGVGVIASPILGRRAYPAPPSAFRVSWRVDAMWYHYQRYLRDPDYLLPMGYFCLTVLQYEVGGPKEAGPQYHVHPTVLRKLGELTANLGDERTARKLHQGSLRRAPTPAERRWIEAVVRGLIRRAGEVAAAPDRDWPQLTTRDFPPLA